MSVILDLHAAMNCSSYRSVFSNHLRLYIQFRDKVLWNAIETTRTCHIRNTMHSSYHARLHSRPCTHLDDLVTWVVCTVGRTKRQQATPSVSAPFNIANCVSHLQPCIRYHAIYNRDVSYRGALPYLLIRFQDEFLFILSLIESCRAGGDTAGLLRWISEDCIL